jgi:ribosomal protein S18 acetylase RimI-like enzyme
LASEVIDIRRFEAGDFARLLEAEQRTWGDALRWDYGPSARIIAACLADKRLAGYALVNQGQIEGYSFVVCEDDKGLIGDFFLLPNGAADQAPRLLEHVLETLLATPGVRRVEAQIPHFPLEKLEPCFHRYGFNTYVRRFMVLDLARRRPLSPEIARDKNSHFEFEPWQRKHDRQLAQLLWHTYRGHVDAAINDQYGSVEGASRLLENITELHGCGELLTSASQVAIHQPTGKLAGVVVMTTVRPRTAHIPQVAVGRDFQAQGLGTALLERAFREAQQHDCREVSLTVTDLNQGAVRLYERLGFETFRSFGAFVWDER